MKGRMVLFNRNGSFGKPANSRTEQGVHEAEHFVTGTEHISFSSNLIAAIERISPTIVSNFNGQFMEQDRQPD